MFSALGSQDGAVFGAGPHACRTHHPFLLAPTALQTLAQRNQAALH